MTVPIAFLTEAEDDIEAAHDFYEARLDGLGERFLAALREVLDRVADFPQLYGVFRKDIRAALLRRFPYVVYFRDRGTDVLVIAVQRGNRSYRGWWGRT